jgi:Avidin family
MRLEHALKHALAGTGALYDFTGNWVNELKSTAKIVQKDMALSGVYESAVSEEGPTKSTRGDLVGYVDGCLIAFTVHWRDFQAITSWVGQLRPDTGIISTLWQMTKRVGDGDQWESINSGADFFNRL